MLYDIPLCECTIIIYHFFLCGHFPLFLQVIIFFNFIYFFVCIGSFVVRSFSSCGERGLLFIVVHRLLTTVASLVVEHRL